MRIQSSSETGVRDTGWWDGVQDGSEPGLESEPRPSLASPCLTGPALGLLPDFSCHLPPPAQSSHPRQARPPTHLPDGEV